MREVELKAVVDDLALRCLAVEEAGGRRVFSGRLEDRRYDTPARALAARDHVLRLRVWRDAAGARASLDWKGATDRTGAYKVREELTAPAGEPGILAEILDRLGYVVTRAIDREVVQYELAGAIVRFEQYPRMDVLVEVEGSPEAIEQAIDMIGLPRASFTSERLPDFAARFRARTGQEPALCDAEISGASHYRLDDA